MKTLFMIILVAPVVLFTPLQGCFLPPPPTPLNVVPVGKPASPGWA
ncbi:MAG TPA: hypothetical protein PKV97_00110 [Thauera aminoaromatica]|nr:hypothetical protein [Thauera aminoaromatica]